MNGGFGLLLDGSAEAEKKARNMLSWDVANGVGGARVWCGVGVWECGMVVWGCGNVV